MIIYKLYKESLSITAHRQRVDDKKIDFYSFDQQTAKIIVQIKSPGDGKTLEAVQDVLIALERGGKKAVHNMTVEDYNENLVSFVLPDNIISQSGSFLCGIYLDYGNNKSLDVGYFRINLKQSLIDKDLPAMEQFYVQSFEELKDDIIQRSSDLQEIIDGIDTDVADKLQTLDDLAEDYAQKAADLEATYAPRLTEVTTQLAHKVGGLHPARMTNVKGAVLSSNTQPRVLDVFNGYVWADNSAGRILRRPADGGNWEDFSNTPGQGQIFRIIPTSDGEVLILTTKNLYKSANFFGTGNTSWQSKVRANGETFFMQWGLDGYENKFIVTSYGGNRSDSRYAWISLDSGDSWEIKYDAVEEHGSTLANGSHMHAVAYDRWGDRFYLSEGHVKEIAGVYISDDDGETWVTNDKLKQDPAPTTLTATPEGIVAGSDHPDNGLYGIIRQKNIEDESMEMVWKWQTGRDGLAGFAQRGFYDEHSGLVYVSFRSDYAGVNPVIAAGTVSSGGKVYEWDSGATPQDRIINIVIPNAKEALFYGRSNNSTVEHSFSATIHPPGASIGENSGNIFGGIADKGDSLAIGFGAKAIGIRTTTIGLNAESRHQDSVAIGNKATNTGADSVSIGTDSTSGANSTVIGRNARSVNGETVAIGRNARTEGSQSVTVGNDSVAHGQAVAIGHNAQTKTHSAKGVAIGHSARADSFSVALGSDVQTTTNYQVAIGQRHIEMTPLSGTSTGALSAERVRLFTRIHDGKRQLCAQFPGADTWANSIVIARQP